MADIFINNDSVPVYIIILAYFFIKGRDFMA